MTIKRSIPVSILVILCTLATLAAACQPAQPAPVLPTGAAEQEPTAQQAAPTPQTAAPPATTGSAPQLSDQPYQSPSGAFSIIFPLGWTCEETGLYQIDCFSSNDDASITMRAIATGYELLQEHFEALVQAETVHAYSNKRAYIEETYGVAEGQVSIDAIWRNEGVEWASHDHFTRQGAGVFHVSLRALKERREHYLPVFEQVDQSAVLQPGPMSSAPLYEPRQVYSARDALFYLQVPTSWMKYAGPLNIENTYVEGFLAPDMRAQVQVAVYRRDSLIEQEDRIALTQDIMRALYGSDVRYSHYKALPDGRERGEWYNERSGISGIAHNGTYRNILYIYSVVWDEVGSDLYFPILQEILDSFTRE